MRFSGPSSALSADDLGQLKEAWTKAYLHTPHGMPVELRGRDHAHDSHTEGAGRD
jgi:surface antigen